MYPTAIDSDQTIQRIDDNITEIGAEVINQIREVIFNIEEELGLGLSGSVTSLANRLNVSINDNGTIKKEALSSIGLVTLPIIDNYIAENAGIKEYKIALDYTTSNLHTLILSNRALLDTLSLYASTTNADFITHLSGSKFISNGNIARHAASNIEINTIPNDPRDLSFIWNGLRDKDNNLRAATNVAEALLEINDDLTAHENSTTHAHTANSIDLDTDNFTEIPYTANTVQKAFDYLNNAEELNIGLHRATQHANGIPKNSRSQSLFNPDGYGSNTIVTDTLVNAYLVNPPSNIPLDSNTVGDDLIVFQPTNSNYNFDAQFSQISVGDIVRINYGNGISAQFFVESFRFIPGSEWVVRINGSNLFQAVNGLVDGYPGLAYARIDKPKYDTNIFGVLSLAAANSVPNNLYSDILGSLIVGSPKGACALGLGFDGNKINSNHYNLWLELYPTGNPVDKIISLPAIDVTGDFGNSPGSYTLEKIVHETNNSFRAIGYNYRFIAFEYHGDFGIMLADDINKASFAIIKGSNATGIVYTDNYKNNIVGDAVDGDGFDALGLGEKAADIASPAYLNNFADSFSAQFPTKVICPVKQRHYIVDGRKLDDFKKGYLTNDDGYWPATIFSKNTTGSSIEVTYRVNLDLCSAKLKPGKTIVIQPEVLLTDSLYSTNDYGRFIIKDVAFSAPCGDIGSYTLITVINGVHATSNGIAFTSAVGLNVRLFFSDSSIGFNKLNVIDSSTTGINYHRYHEIYINKNGETFSHERARMLSDQVESSPPTSLLSSNNWHIKNVSSKLRGYRDSSSTFNKYIRFYITRYDSVSGEYDGYIGKRNYTNSNITNTGPITTSRKNIVTKFYDETYNDYIELEFKEKNIGPIGSYLLSDNNPRYVDIELFHSLKDNKELLLLGSCEVNWNPPANQYIIQCVKDLREFGSIGAEEFNTSAIDFISGVDKVLHENGVIRGFDYVSSGISNGELFFKGGEALVNGKLVITSNSSVTIPAISDGGVAGDVTWAVCVNEHGYLEPIILTNTKDQIFAGSSYDYYVPSVTFAELVYSRKDLTLIYTVTAHIASITINDSDIVDARRFISSQGHSFPLELNIDNNVGNFHNFTALRNWLINLNGTKNTVKINGTFNINSSIDFTGFTSKVVFEGDGAIFNVTSSKGILVGSNVTFRNIKFIYSPVDTFTTNYVNSDNGCLYGILSSNNLSNITIEDCIFQTSNTTVARPPYISFQIQKGYILDNISIKNNRFSDTGSSIYEAAIAIVDNLLGSGTNSAAVSNCYIENNICDAAQGIYITSYAVSGFLTGIGLNTYNVNVIGNTCGVIGIINSLNYNTNINSPSSVVIKNNRCKFIGALDGVIGITPLLSLTPTYGSGNIIVDGNYCHWIHILAQDLVINNQYADLKIINNFLTANDNTFLTKLNGSGTTTDVAIKILTNYGSAQTNSFLISHNSIDFGRYGGVTYKYYTAGIMAQSSAIITNNIIRGLGQIPLSTLSCGIIISPGTFSNGSRHHIVTGNKIYRGSQSLQYYIMVTTATTTDSGIVTDNFVDSTTVDGSSIVLFSCPTFWIVTRNKNQTGVTYLSGESGNMETGNVHVGTFSTGVSVNIDNTPPLGTAGIVILYNGSAAGGNIKTINWYLPLFATLPEGVYVTEFEITAKCDTIFETAGSVQLVSQTLNTGVHTSNVLDFTSAGSGYTVNTSLSAVISFTSNTYLNTFLIAPQEQPRLQVNIVMDSNSTDNIFISLQAIKITYRW